MTSQRSERKNRRPAGLAVVQDEVVGAGQRAERRCSRLLGGSCAARADVQSAGAGALRARERRERGSGSG